MAQIYPNPDWVAMEGRSLAVYADELKDLRHKIEEELDAILSCSLVKDTFSQFITELHPMVVRYEELLRAMSEYMEKISLELTIVDEPYQTFKK